MAHIWVGSRGVDHPAWMDDFFPEDLPSEWKLSYYSNEFRLLLLRASDLQEVAENELNEWLDELDEEFRLLYELEPDEGEAAPQLPQALLARLDSYLYGCSREGLLSSGQLTNLQGKPLYYRLSEQSSASARLALQFADPALLTAPPLLFVDATLSLRRLREEIETVLQTTSVNELLLVVEGEPPDIKFLRQCRVLAELMA